MLRSVVEHFFDTLKNFEYNIVTRLQDRSNGIANLSYTIFVYFVSMVHASQFAKFYGSFSDVLYTWMVMWRRKSGVRCSGWCRGWFALFRWALRTVLTLPMLILKVISAAFTNVDGVAVPKSFATNSTSFVF